MQSSFATSFGADTTAYLKWTIERCRTIRTILDSLLFSKVTFASILRLFNTVVSVGHVFLDDVRLLLVIGFYTQNLPTAPGESLLTTDSIYGIKVDGLTPFRKRASILRDQPIANRISSDFIASVESISWPGPLHHHSKSVAKTKHAEICSIFTRFEEARL